jgi:hypothetical protein
LLYCTAASTVPTLLNQFDVESSSVALAVNFLGNQGLANSWTRQDERPGLYLWYFQFYVYLSILLHSLFKNIIQIRCTREHWTPRREGNDKHETRCNESAHKQVLHSSITQTATAPNTGMIISFSIFTILFYIWNKILDSTKKYGHKINKCSVTVFALNNLKMATYGRNMLWHNQ